MDVKLRIIGEPSEADHAMLRGFKIDYEWMSKLSDEEMQEAYATSDALLFCSTLEGFGMPILEAKAVGLPVITSDKEPMSEVGRGWAHVINLSNPESIRKGVSQTLSSNGIKASFVEKVNCQKNVFTHLVLYSECLEKSYSNSH